MNLPLPNNVIASLAPPLIFSTPITSTIIGIRLVSISLNIMISRFARLRAYSRASFPDASNPKIVSIVDRSGRLAVKSLYSNPPALIAPARHLLQYLLRILFINVAVINQSFRRCYRRGHPAGSASDWNAKSDEIGSLDCWDDHMDIRPRQAVVRQAVCTRDWEFGE